MALGRAEALFEATGNPVAITRLGGYARAHDAWKGNPAWNALPEGQLVPRHMAQIEDGGGCRPYIKHWNGRQITYDMDYRARAGKIHVTEAEIDWCKIEGEFAVIAPDIKTTASPNKQYKHWEKVIEGFPIPVYQLTPDNRTDVIRGAQRYITPHFRQACAVISKARLVLCNEGGSHHMAASMGVPAVVIFGSFVPPKVTGYDFHTNISVETEHGFCGNFDTCKTCQANLETIKPEYVRAEALKILERK